MSLDDFTKQEEVSSPDTNLNMSEVCHDVNRRGQHCKNKATWAYLYAEPDIEQDVPGLTLYFCDICKAKWEEEFKDTEHWSPV